MVKNEIAKAVANKLEGCTIKDAVAVLDAFEEVIIETLKADPTEAVPVGKIGKFRVKDVTAKSGVSKLGGVEKPWSTEAHQEITFKVNKSAKTL